jgi:hypothetical protein
MQEHRLLLAFWSIVLPASSGRLNRVHVDTVVIREREIVQLYDKVASDVVNQNYGKGNDACSR